MPTSCVYTNRAEIGLQVTPKAKLKPSLSKEPDETQVLIFLKLYIAIPMLGHVIRGTTLDLQGPRLRPLTHC